MVKQLQKIYFILKILLIYVIQLQLQSMHMQMLILLKEFLLDLYMENYLINQILN